jgi:hypothetical protein
LLGERIKVSSFRGFTGGLTGRDHAEAIYTKVLLQHTCTYPPHLLTYRIRAV